MTYQNDVRDEAKTLYESGQTVEEIQKKLKVPVPLRTIRAWRKKDKWEEPDRNGWGLVMTRLARDVTQLMDKEKWTEDEEKRFNILTDKLEQFRIRQEAFDIKQRKIFEGDFSGKKKRGKKNDFTGIDLNALKTPDFFAYQLKFLDMKEEVRFVLKSRQIGFSYVIAWEGLITGLKTGINQIFISASKNQVGTIRKYIKQFAREFFGVDLTGKDEITVITPDEKEVTFYFLSTNSNTTQGYNGDLYIDEFCWIPKVNDILDTAKAMSSHLNRRITYISTPSVKTHPGYLIWKGLDEKGKKLKDKIGRMKITLKQAIKQGCTLFKPIKELREIFTPRQFKFLYECKWIDNAGSIFKMEDLEVCAYKEKYKNDDGHYAWEPVDLPEYKDEGFENYLGYDPNGGGEDGDNASCAVGSNRIDKLRIIDHKSFNNASVDWQAGQIKRMVVEYRVKNIGIDTTGVGLSIWNKVKDIQQDPRITWRINVVPINYTWEMKQKLVLDLEQIVSRKILEFSASDQELINAFLAIKTTATKSGGKTTFVADRKSSIGHADLFWAVSHLASFFPLKDSLFNQAPLPGGAMSG
jgi:uncharacterized protein YjcR